MTKRKNTWMAVCLCSLLLLLLVACTFPDIGGNGAEQTTQSATSTEETIATLGTVTKQPVSTTAPLVSDTAQSTTAGTTSRPPIDDGFPNETEGGDTKRY